MWKEEKSTVQYVRFNEKMNAGKYATDRIPVPVDMKTILLVNMGIKVFECFVNYCNVQQMLYFYYSNSL